MIALGVMLGVIYFLVDQPIITPQPAVSTQPAEITNLTIPSPAPNEPTPELVLRRPVQLLIPRARVIAPVMRVHLENGSWDVSQLGISVGHLSGTAWLREPGNIVLAGHVEMADGTPGVFANLADLETGDELLLMEENAEPLVYIVSSIRTVQPDDLSVLYPSDTEDLLTLITCGEYDLLSNSYLVRVVVQAARIR